MQLTRKVRVIYMKILYQIEMHDSRIDVTTLSYFFGVSWLSGLELTPATRGRTPHTLKSSEATVRTCVSCDSINRISGPP
jgi:hypothetical protein